MKMEARVRLDDMSAKRLAQTLTQVPASAKVSVYNYSGDRPFESGYSELIFTWDTEKDE